MHVIESSPQALQTSPLSPEREGRDPPPWLCKQSQPRRIPPDTYLREDNTGRLSVSLRENKRQTCFLEIILGKLSSYSPSPGNSPSKFLSCCATWTCPTLMPHPLPPPGLAVWHSTLLVMVSHLHGFAHAKPCALHAPSSPCPPLTTLT